MCEQFVARAAEPFRLADLWPFAERLERFGVAGFGWGASWVQADGSLCSHRDTRAFRDDPATAALGDVETTAALVHLRRPSKLSTLQLPDAQPFDDPAGRFSFSHNGDLKETRADRRRFAAAGRIHGRADTEVGQRWLEDAWDGAASPAGALRALHERFGGQANLAVLLPDGQAVTYAGNTENPVFTFRLGPIGVASTALYSLDRSVFAWAAPEATERRLVRPGTTIALDRHGSPSPAS